jgi:segregation and condensation protein A
MTQIKLQQFEGPLDLLLSLIEQQELDITQISLAQVTEQFLTYVKQLEQIDATELADYLTIAAKLLVIKSKAILPSLEVETPEEEAEEDLTTKLLQYKQFKEAAKYFKNLDAQGHQSFTRTRVFSERVHFFPDPAVDAAALRQAISKVVDALKELDNLPKAKIREAISIQEKITHLQFHLSSQIETRMSDLIAGAKNKEEVIITFLALLELIKQRLFSVDQNALFTDITIKKYSVTPVEIEVVEEVENLEEDDDED